MVIVEGKNRPWAIKIDLHVPVEVGKVMDELFNTITVAPTIKLAHPIDFEPKKAVLVLLQPEDAAVFRVLPENNDNVFEVILATRSEFIKNHSYAN